MLFLLYGFQGVAMKVLKYVKHGQILRYAVTRELLGDNNSDQNTAEIKYIIKKIENVWQ